MAQKPVRKYGGGGGLRVMEGAAVVAVAVVGVVIAFAALHFVAGILWGVVKVVVIAGIVGGLVWALGRRRRRQW
ncbi:MAG: hypothetical protein ACRDVP_00945 [Acidimicrobiales bacterium]